MMKKIAAKVLSVWSVVAVAALLGAIAIPAQISAACKGGQSSGAKRKQSTVELTTDPSPAQKGSNTVRVKLADPSGKPISGAQVTITFSMAAMPEMGMAAMKTVIKAEDKGDGMYEGKGDLGSAGTWQVSISAQQGGKTIASKKLSVKATGGM